MTDPVVQLIRRFEPVSQHRDWDFLGRSGDAKPLGWHQLTDEYRVLILADPGAGKTFEAKDRANKMRGKGAKAFFIRIEGIDAEFEGAFEVGAAEEFADWQASTEEAWFFLDSVDEAQLETPRALEKAIELFGARIHDARERAHIFITSREDAWQALSDRNLVEQHLPHGAPSEQEETDAESKDRDPVLKVYRLAGLRNDEIRLFAAHFGVGDVNDFLAAVERGSLEQLAERPFDLKALIRKWLADGVLGSRFEVLQRLIELQLAPLSLTTAKPWIDPAKARTGARALAAAVTLSGKNVICMPGGVMSADRIDLTQALPEWTAGELNALLRTGTFDDIVYTSVRFRHREIRELLTAEWAHSLLARPEARAEVEQLFFRNQYGEDVLIPRMRPTLTWLLLLDDGIRDRALSIEPEIASEGGDPSRLPLQVRQAMLASIVERIAKGDER